jgi:hypothetical protein
MEYEQVKFSLDNAPSIKLLRGRNTALLVSFLHRQFKAAHRITIPQPELEERLGDYLEFLGELYPGEYGRSPREYLNEWCESQFLRKTFEMGSDDPVFALTPDVERVLVWFEELEQREFVGTESRFLQIFALLKEIRDGSTTDATDRIVQLEEDRDRLQAEIDRIRETGVVERYNRTQIQEWFLLANQTARQLVADFAEVEQNFRTLTRRVQMAQLQANASKGSVVGQVLDADDELKESDQGRSFYAFWNFLMSETKRTELRSLLDTVYGLEELRPVSQQQLLLRRIERNLIESGEHIVRSNYRLAAKLRQMLDERSLTENRRIAELIGDFQRLAIQQGEALLPDTSFADISGDPDVKLMMERPLHPLEATAPVTFLPTLMTLPAVDLDVELAGLYDQFYIDQELLLRQIEQALAQQTQVTLAQLVELFPVQQGLPEIVEYLAIAAKFEQHQINDAIQEAIVIEAIDRQRQLQLTLPQVIFRR